jgi:hypothetical protein
MTTGRINQVTILIQAAPLGGHGREAPLAGGGALQGRGARGRAPSRKGRPAFAGRRRATIQLPPLSLPRERSAAERSGLSTSTPGSIRTSDGQTQSPVTLKAVTDECTPAEGLVEQWLLTNHPQAP